MVQIQEASRRDLAVRLIAAAARDHGPAVFVLGPSAAHLLIAGLIVRHGLPVDLVAAGADSGPVRAYVARLYGLEGNRIRTADTLEAALFGKKAWITAARGSAAAHPLPAYEYDAAQGLLRFHPLAEWTEAEVHAFDAAVRLAA